MVAEKKMLEQFVRSSDTSNSGSGHGEEQPVVPRYESMRRYSAAMSAKLEQSAAEIKQLLELLDQQSATITLMADTHQKEIDLNMEELDALERELDELAEEAGMHRANAMSLTTQLETALNEGIALRADLLKARSSRSEHDRAQHDLQERHEQAQRTLTESKDAHARAISEHTARSDALQAKLDDALAQKAKLEAAQAELQQQLADAHKANEEHNRRVADLEQQLQRAQRAHAQEMSDMRDGQEARISDMMALHDSELADLQASLQTARGEAGSVEATQNRLQSLVQEHQVSMATQKTLSERILSEAKSAHATEIKSMRDELDALKQTHSQAAAQQEKEKAEVEKEKAAESEKDAQIDTLNRQLAKVMEELDDREKQLGTSKATIQELQSAGEARPKSAASSVKRLRFAEIEGEKDKDKDALAELKRVQTAHETIQANANRMLELQNRELAKLKSEMSSLIEDQVKALTSVEAAEARAAAAEREQASLRVELAELQAKTVANSAKAKPVSSQGCVYWTHDRSADRLWLLTDIG